MAEPGRSLHAVPLWHVCAWFGPVDHDVELAIENKHSEQTLQPGSKIRLGDCCVFGWPEPVMIKDPGFLSLPGRVPLPLCV